jgi:predicted porin
MTWGNTQSCFGQGGAWGDCNGLTQNVVRYDSPTFGGFSVSASWGEDDMWDVAGRYAGEWGGFKLAAAVAYNEVTDQRYNGGVAVPDQQYFQAGAFLMHVPTGLFGLVNYGDLQTDALVTGDPTLDIGAGDAQTWYGKIGLRSRFSSLGHTVFYGEYLNGQGGAVGVDDVLANNDPADDTTFDDDRRVVMGGSELEVWGAGIVQEIDAAAMSVWVKYRHLSASGLVDSEGVAIGSEDFQYVGVGALINF